MHRGQQIEKEHLYEKMVMQVLKQSPLYLFFPVDSTQSAWLMTLH